MGANAFQYDVKLNLSADTKLARTQIESLQSQLKSISNLNLNFNGIDQLTSKVNEASDAALKLQTHLAAALNPDTGNLDFSKFNNSILRSGDSIENLSYSLLKAGSSGTKAFVSLADSISRSEIPLLRTSKLVNGLYDNLKKTAGWQISSSIIHGVMGQYQQAIGYAKALDKSLTDIRIVTGQSADQMARFAKEANAAAKKLSTTTVDYTDASLIYYQQGLSDAEVKKRSDITIKMANATGVSAAKVSDQLTSIWNNFDNGTKSLEYYADVMTALGAATASSTDEIAKGVQKFAAISDTVGLSYEYATSALATITATTRESADTVGNSLKTLFSRIQGLQLGDTLDDGTTLNKYSTALAKVGISIKNANGELKSMDTLLNEMGSKWNTLAEDQQMALAQTVGGARQYTQIMTLMENWDFFKENLTTAKTATGTLTQQAEIYADSWEAAQKRFKASQESLYDTLINSNSFKKILNIGSTIVEGISNALSGTNGLPGLLGTIGPILGMTFKKQLGESLSSTLYNIGSLIPGVRKGIENARQVQLTNMLHSIRDAEVTPDLGKHERNATASIIERQYTEREQKEKYRAKMSGASEALDVEYEKLLKNIDEQQLDLSRQQDEAELNAEYAADALRNEKYNKRNIGSELTDSFGKVLVSDSLLGQDNDIAHALKLVGAREGQAEIDLDQLVQKMTADKSNAFDLGQNLDEEMANIFGDMLGASQDEAVKLRTKGATFTTDREKVLKSQFDALIGDYQAAKTEMLNQYGDNPRAFASELPNILRMVTEDYETRVLTSLGFMEDGVTIGEQTNAKDIISNSSRAAVLKREQEKRGQTRQGVVDKREALWAQSGPSLAESVVGIGSGIGATYGAIQSAYGTFNSIKDGNWGGALTGLIATGYNMTSGMGDLTQSFQDLGRHGKALKNRPDIQKYNLLQQQQELQLKQSQVNELDKGIEQDKKRLDYLLQSKALNEQEQTDLNNLEKKAKEGKLQSKADKNRLEGLRDKQERYINNFLPEVKNLQLGITSQEAKKDEIGFNPETLKKVSKDLEKLDDVTAGKFSGAINKVGDGLEFVSKHADKFTIGLQAAQIAMTATAKINEYFYNEETRQAQKAATTANELANAHQTAQNNYNLLLNSIEEYNTKTNELADSNLKGAAKQAAIYDQNQAALNLIDKYNITDFKYIGDKIQISEDALEKAQEESIQAMSTAKYASGLANLSAKKEANDVIEEALERDLVYDESFQQGAGVLLAGASGAAIGATIGSVVPVIGTAIGGIVGGIAGTLVGAVNAAWADDIGERERENSFVDKAIEKTRETGSTSWMDDYAGDEFSADELKKLKENRSAIKQQAASEAAYEQAELAHRESIANDILANNDRTEKFEYADRLLDGLASEVKDWEKLGDTYGEWYESEKTRINAAKNIQSELGLSGNVMWEDNKANKMLTYTTEDGQTGTLSYDTLSKMEGVKKGKAESGAYIEQMMDMYEAVKADSNEATAAGVISYLSSGNFDNATFTEGEAAAKYLQGVLKNTDISQDNKAKALGYEDLNALKAELLTTTDFSTITGYDDYGNAIKTVTTENINAYLDKVNSDLANELTGDNYVKDQLSTYGISNEGTYSDLYNSLTRVSGEKLNNQLKLMGEEGASEYLTALKGMLKGADPDDVDDIITSLMALDGSDWGIDSSIIEIMDEYGITIDNTNQYLQDFVNLTREAYGAIPDLTEEMGSLISVAGSIKNLKIGDSIDASTMQSLEAQGYDLSDETFSTWNGENVLIKSPEELQGQVRADTAQTYSDYMDRVNAVTGAFGEGVDYKKWLEESHLLTGTEEDFMDLITTDDGVNITDQITKNILGDRFDQLTGDIETKKALEEKMAGYKIENGVLMKMQTDGTYKPVPAGGDGTYTSVADFQNDQKQLAQVSSNISTAWEAVKGAAGEAMDPAEAQKIAEQYASTFSSYQDMMGDATIQEMMDNGHLSESDALSYYASKYPELIEYVNAYNEAVASNNPTLKEQAENQMRVGVAMQDALANYTAMTGKKADLADLNATITALKNDMDEETLAKYNDEELVRLAEETMIAGVGWSSLQKHGSSWNSAIEKLDDKDATAAQLNQGYEAAGKMGKAMQQYLGLTEYDITGITKQDKDNPIVKAINELNIDITKILNKDVNETNKLRAYLVSQSTAGQSLSTKLGITGFGTKDETANNTNAGKAYKAMKDAVGEDGSIDEDKLAEANQDMLASLQSGEITWEEYKASVEMATGGQKTANRTGVARTYYDSTGQRLQKNADGTFSGVGGAMHGKPAVGNVTTVERQTRINNNGQVEVNMGTDSTGATKWVTHNETTHGANENLDGSPMDPTKTTTGGGGGGGGGGGPTKVAVKSAQELMTRYKTIDAKSSIAEMQKANALTQKDLLYGEAKIAQLQKINGLLVKQQRLTADRIEEERQYLEEDKKHLQEVLDRYNKDKKDKDGKVKEGEELLELEFNSEGIITNYKQTIGAMAEELAAFYRDGELTSEEGKKAEELQKKIADLNVVIQDYEDSLNQLQTSIDTYEQTLYEMFANQAEELAYKVTYKLEMENDDLTYVKFYATALKDSTDRMYDYIDLIGQQAGEFKDQIEVYNQGVEDLISNAENNPMYTFATGGLEGVLTAEDVTNLRTYRDELNTTYTSMVALRKEVEEKVLKVFDEWHDKVNKNVDSISRYTDMLSQFKDVINVIGKETLGLSDAFMKNFEQKSIDQSRDNIEAAKQQYESLAEIYANAQDKLEAARADGNEETIKHWEEVVDKTQSEMEGAQDAILTTLNHTLNLIAEQFTNAINEAIDTFNESIYEFGGLDGLIADYEQIREQRDLMVEDYEKIYSLNKLNRQIEKTLDDTKIIAGKQKLLEFQEKINDLNRNNVELSKFELEYLQAEYELRLAEIELENARTAKDTVRLSRDSEGNWSYIYTQNESAIDEAQQKYEDALYKMQQTTQEYQNEMSTSMMEAAQQMRDEIAELNIQELGPEKFQEEMDRIKEKYAEQLAFYENELNKSISTSKNLYDEDWQNYSAATGYKLSAAQDWADSYSETTLGGLMGSGQYMSDYASTIMASADVMTESMSQAAITYFNESNKALETYGTSIEGFSSHLQTTTSQITASSKQATADVTTMAADMVDAFSKVADEVKNWQDTFGEEISMLLDEIGNKIQEINDLIKKSNELGKNNYSSTDLIGQAEAIELINKETFNNKNLFGTWTFDEENGVARGTYTDASGEVKQDVERNIVEFTGQLVEMIDELTGKYYDAKTDSPEREMYGEQLKKLFQDYWKFKNIVNRIYDLTDITIPEPKLDKDKVEGLATGGYTGEWGDSGKLAFLHEKELVLNKDDTANFLDALNISRQLVEMIEMNARASSLGLGEMYASSIQDHNQTLEQSVSITAEFPNATDHSEIEEAFDNLINMASQYAYRN